jgi:hypothetical protein
MAKKMREDNMKRAPLTAILGVLIVLLACTNIQSSSDVPRISKDELKAKLGSPVIVLIDVRTKSDWDRSSEKITGAVRMEPDSVEVWAGTLPKDKEIVFYCS